MKNFFGILSLLVLISSCGKDPVTTNNNGNSTNPWDTVTAYQGILLASEGSINLNFSHYYGTVPVVYVSKQFTNAAGDTFNIENISYRISNVSLQKPDGNWINLGNYHLNNGPDAFKYSLNLPKVPAGVYRRISFLLGVDSVRNHTGDQSGGLDPTYMYWNWTSGYIFFRLNGRLKDNNTYGYDIGGDENLLNFELDMSGYKVKKSLINVDVKLDVKEFFHNPYNYSIKNDGAMVHAPAAPAMIKLLPNMGDMFSLSDVK